MQADDPTSDVSWYAEAAAPALERPRLTFDLDVDVCVVGGGLAGLTTAREIARRGWSVALLEAQTVGAGASGRNLGFVIPGFQEDAERIVERVGLDHARELWALSEQGVDYVRDTVSDTAMPGVEPVAGWINVSKFREDPKILAEANLLSEKFGAQVEIWSKQQVRAVLKSPLYQNGIHFPHAFHIHPRNYALGLAAAAEQAGVRIFEHTPALSFDPTGIRKRIGTPSARVRAPQIVLAGNTGLAALAPQLAASLLPVTSFVALTAPLGDKLREAITYQGGVSDSESVDNHYRIIDGDRLIWSGGQWMWDADPRRYARRIAADIRRAFPRLGKVVVERIWSGTASVAVHGMPQIGEMARGVWVANAFSGQGLNTTAVAGQLIARGVVDNDETWRLFSPYDLVWAGGTAGRVAWQVQHWMHRTRERFDALLLAEEISPEQPASATSMAEPVSVPIAEQPAMEIPLMPAAPVAAAAATAPASQAVDGTASPAGTVPAGHPPAPAAREPRRKPAKDKATAAPNKSAKKAAVTGEKAEAKIAPEAEPPAAGIAPEAEPPAAGRITAES